MKSLEELQAIRERVAAHLNNRDSMKADDIRVIVGMGTCGIEAGARTVLLTFMEEVEAKKLANVKVTQSGCMGVCKCEPVVEVYIPGKEKVTYANVNSDKVREIVNSHIINGKPVAEYMRSDK